MDTELFMDHNSLNVFVYGTLRQGNGNFHQYLGVHNPDEIKSAVLTDYSLLEKDDEGNWTFYDEEIQERVPLAVQKPGGYIRGQVVRFCDRMPDQIQSIVASLDHLEGHPDIYNRITVVTSEGEAICYMYNWRSNLDSL